jgi:signal peptidase I
MEPTLHDGDRLLVLHGAAPRLGGLVVVRLPGGVVAVKRTTRREPDGWWVERDNPAEGVDSWSVGAIADADVVARVLVRWWPPRRLARRVSRRPHLR